MHKHHTTITENHATQSSYLLPDFCDNQTLLLVILIAELLAIVLSLSHDGGQTGLFTYLGYSSLFIQAVALSDVALLCCLQKKIQQLEPRTAAIAIYLGLQLITLSLTLLSIFIIKATALDIIFAEDWEQTSLIRNLSISAIITAILMRYFYIRHQWLRQLEIETRMRIQALQARIRPHFLFNSLNTIANLIHANPNTAEDAVLDLADMFRATLAEISTITLADEISITERYLRMEKRRLGQRLQIDWHIEELCKTIRLPALILQPLVENAIYHGIEPLPTGGTVSIHIQMDAKRNMHIAISNPKNTHANPNWQSKPGNQMALKNIEQRLTLTYYNKDTLKIITDENSYTVIIKIPPTYA